MEGSAGGRFIAGFAFMWLRGHSPEREPDEKLASLVHGAGETREARVELRPMLQGKRIPVFWGLARLLLMPYDNAFGDQEGRTAIVDVCDRSWALVDCDRGRVIQGGPRRLWDALESLYAQLERLGRPSRDRFGLTVRPDGSHVLWLDDPNSEHRWELGNAWLAGGRR